MDNQARCSKSFSCESLFNERHSLKRKYNKVFETSTTSTINTSITSNTSTNTGAAAAAANLSFKNDDYNYLINNNELIMTCREALLENERSIKLNNAEELKLLAPNFSHKADPKATAVPIDNISIKEFSKWLNRTEEHLESVCYCSLPEFTANNNTKNSSNGHHQREWIDAITEHKAIQAEIQSVGRKFINSLKANVNGVSKTLLTAEETRWHNLWLKSFECLMILEENHTCPNHSHRNRERLSTPFERSKRYKYGPQKLAYSEGKENIGGMMRNRRIQTTMVGTAALNETFNVANSKFEIIHKDIGYSSDADMSDACEPASCQNYNNSTIKSPRKRHRRRRPRIGERPWSFHSEWTGWDYYQPPLGFSGEYRSSEDLNSYEDENLVRSLTEFGENYERWFKPDDGLMRASTPSPSATPSPSEQSERQVTDDERHHEEKNFCPPGNETITLEKPVDKLTQATYIINGSINTSTITNNTRTINNTTANIATNTSSTSSTSSTNNTTRSFLIYLTITVIVALILSALVAHLSPLSPHVHKSYPSRTPPN